MTEVAADTEDIKKSPSGPPAKRQKTDADANGSQNGQDQDAENGDGSASNHKTKTHGRGKDEKDTPKTYPTVSPLSARPIVVLMTPSSEGKHLVVLTGHDKAVFVLEHVGEGNLKELSKR